MKFIVDELPDHTSNCPYRESSCPDGKGYENKCKLSGGAVYCPYEKIEDNECGMCVTYNKYLINNNIRMCVVPLNYVSPFEREERRMIDGST